MDTLPARHPSLNNEALALLACPCCKAPLTVARDALNCQDSVCQKVFPIVDEIPILIDEDNSVFALSDFLCKRDTFFASRAPLIQRLRKLVPTISTNLKSKKNYAAFASLALQSNAKPRILILGGSILGDGLEILLEQTDIQLIESDVAFGPRTAVIMDGHSIPFQDETFDGVVAQAVLEHVVDPYKVVDEIHRILKPDGIVYAETPFMQQVHGGRYDFTRFTHLGHRWLFRRFDEHSSGAVAGTGTVLAWSYRYFLMSLSNTRWVQRLLSLLAAFTSFWLKYIDRFNIDTPASLDAASCLFFLGRKSTAALSDKELVEQYRGIMS